MARDRLTGRDAHHHGRTARPGINPWTAALVVLWLLLLGFLLHHVSECDHDANDCPLCQTAQALALPAIALVLSALGIWRQLSTEPTTGVAERYLPHFRSRGPPL